MNNTRMVLKKEYVFDSEYETLRHKQLKYK